jgi:hypothetical protein
MFGRSKKPAAKVDSATEFATSLDAIVAEARAKKVDTRYLVKQLERHAEELRLYFVMTAPLDHSTEW